VAIQGRKPKRDGQARHRNPLVHQWTEVPDVPFVGGAELPERRGCGRPWPERTREKWEVWRSMPHCVLWQPSDWAFALTAIELAAYVHDGETRLAGELRNGRRSWAPPTRRGGISGLGTWSLSRSTRCRSL
jgi:hypothetical protein